MRHRHATRAAYVAIGTLLLLLVIVPRPFIARGTIMIDPAALAASAGRFGQLGARSLAKATTPGGYDPLKVAAVVARSQAPSAQHPAEIAAVQVHLLDGGLIEIMARGTRPGQLRAAVAERLGATLSHLAAASVPARLADPAHLDPERGYNAEPLALLGLLVLLVLLMEFFLPVTTITTAAAWGEE